MKKILLSVLGILVAIIALVLIIASFRPADWKIERSTTINAPRETVWALVSNLDRYGEWSPFAQLDPNMSKTIENHGAQVGSTYAWDGNKEAGAGKMTFVDVKPLESIQIELDFLRPFPATNRVDYTFREEGGQTNFTWTMTGKYEGLSGLMGKTFDMLMDMDKMVGAEFEKGLTAVKTISEREAVAAPATTIPDGEVTFKELVITRSFDAPRAALWKAWTDPEQVMRWWGPKSYTSPTCKIDLRVGGKYLFSMRSPEGQTFYSTGTYTKIEPETLLEADDSFADENGNIVPASHYGMPANFPLKSKLTVTLEDEAPGKTKMTIKQESVPAGQMYDYSVAGWNESFDKLDGILTK